MRAIGLLALLIVGIGCGGPFLIIPGGALRGQVVQEPVDDWSFVTSRFVDRLDPREG